MNNEYYTLLKTWCDRLLELQLDMPDPELNGAIICPACHIIHGRCGDLIYPLLTLADISGEERYIVAAKRLFDWTENNMSRPDGSVINDRLNLWKGISVFYAWGLIEALQHHGHILDTATRAKLTERAKELLDFLIPFTKNSNTAVNYYAATCGALALGYKYFDDERYLNAANEYAELVLPFINDEGFLVGEPKALIAPSKKGFNLVDIGYNAEESLPALIKYYQITGSQKILEPLKKALSTHMDFYLTDGGLDNSFGSRSPKWTYWGSRTSDGCQEGFADMAAFDPRYAEIVHRNFLLLRDCTKDGLLHGGPMYISENEPPCIHHSFCHAKALAHLVDIGFSHKGRLPLPMDCGDKAKHYNTIGTHIVRHGKFRGTVTENDYPPITNNFRSTSCLTFLMHDDAGVIFAASMPQYSMPEITNMQFSVHSDSLCNTPRIEKIENDNIYTNINDRGASLSVVRSGYNYELSGVLRDAEQNGSNRFNIKYYFKADRFVAEYLCFSDATLYLPVVSKSGEKVELSKTTLTVHRKDCILEITADSEIALPTKKRNFNPVGGFATLMAEIPLKANVPCVVTVKVK